MTARLLVGDVFDRMAELPDHSFDLILTSPPFLALRSYLPDDHPDKAKEIGSEATPAEFLDTLLELTAVWRRLLAPYGSLVVELGDTYAGSGGAGGDYDPDGLRAGQERFDGSASRAYGTGGRPRPARNGIAPGWPLEKSLTGIPTLYTWSLAYGRNLLRQPLTARELLEHAEELTDDFPEMSARYLLKQLRSFLARHEELGRGPGIEIEPWRIRNLKPWIRTNPPVGALGDKERPATSYITVATLARDRWFDLDAVRTTPAPHGGNTNLGSKKAGKNGYSGFGRDVRERVEHPAGAPPLDWVHTVDLILDNELDTRAGKLSTNNPQKPGDDLTPGRLGDGDGSNNGGKGRATLGAHSVGARGHHLRRRLEAAGYFTTLDALDISPKGYAGAHYAVWPPELCQRLIDEMCPRRVCTQCGEPSRRIVETTPTFDGKPIEAGKRLGTLGGKPSDTGVDHNRFHTERTTLGWSDCGHNTWRPGHVLDPFAGSGTTLAVATGMGRDSTGIDLDPRNADLARERCGMFLEIDEGNKEGVA